MGFKNRNIATLWQNYCGELMMRKFQTKMRWVAAVGLVIGSLLCIVFIGDRVAAAFFNLWIFSGYPHRQGIDLGVNSSFLFLIVCLHGLAGCFALVIIYKPQAGTTFSRIVTIAGIMYLISGLLLFLMVLSGIGYLYCGR